MARRSIRIRTVNTPRASTLTIVREQIPSRTPTIINERDSSTARIVTVTAMATTSLATTARETSITATARATTATVTTIRDGPSKRGLVAAEEGISADGARGHQRSF